MSNVDSQGLPEVRLTYWTECNRATYPLPPHHRVLEVRYVGREYPRPLLIFEVPLGHSYWRVYSMDGPPKSLEAVREMLHVAWSHFHRNLWFQWGQTLVLYPPPPNDGEILVVIAEPT